MIASPIDSVDRIPLDHFQDNLQNAEDLGQDTRSVLRVHL